MEKEINNNIHFVSLAKTEKPAFIEQPRLDWVKAGADNQLFNNLIEYAQGYSPTHTSILNTKIKKVAGSQWTVIKGAEDLMPNDQDSFIELSEKCSADLETVGAYALEVIWSAGKTILEFNHIPIQYLRYEKMNSKNKIMGMYYCRDWSNTRKNQPVFIPFYNEKEPTGRQVLLVKKYWAGCPYTILPTYFPATNYIKVDEKISNFHLSNISNGMNPSLIINLNNGISDPQTQKDTVEKINQKYRDTENAGKMLIMFNKSKDTAAEITQLEGNKMHEMFLILNETTTQEILTSHQLTNPLLAGVKVPSSLGGSQELLQSWELFNKNVIEPDQEMILNGFNKLLAINNNEVEVMNNNVIQFGFSENLLKEILDRNELREIIGYETIEEVEETKKTEDDE